MCKLTKNLSIQGVLDFQVSGWRFFTRGRVNSGGPGVETPVGAMLWDI